LYAGGEGIHAYINLPKALKGISLSIFAEIAEISNKVCGYFAERLRCRFG